MQHADTVYLYVYVHTQVLDLLVKKVVPHSLQSEVEEFIKVCGTVHIFVNTARLSRRELTG